MKTRFAAAGLFAVLAISLTSLATRGQVAERPVDADLAALDQKIKDFLERITYEDIATAYQELLKSSPLASQTEAVTGLVQKTRLIQERYGTVRDFEQVSARRVGKDLVLMRYLYKCESCPVVWHITYYRTTKRGEVPRDSDWSVVSVRFDTNTEVLALGQ